MGSCITMLFDNLKCFQRSVSPFSKMEWQVRLFSPRFGSVDAVFPEDIQRAQGLLSKVTVARSGTACECLEQRDGFFQNLLIGFSQCIGDWRSDSIRNNGSTNQSYIEQAAGKVVAMKGRWDVKLLSEEFWPFFLTSVATPTPWSSSTDSAYHKCCECHCCSKNLQFKL